jgi:hypothetical protein
MGYSEAYIDQQTLQYGQAASLAIIYSFATAQQSLSTAYTVTLMRSTQLAALPLCGVYVLYTVVPAAVLV